MCIRLVIEGSIAYIYEKSKSAMLCLRRVEKHALNLALFGHSFFRGVSDFFLKIFFLIFCRVKVGFDRILTHFFSCQNHVLICDTFLFFFSI